MCCENPARRKLLKGAACISGASALGLTSALMPNMAYAAALDKKTRDAMTPDQVIAFLKEGNDRFINGKMVQHDFRAQKKSSANGQYPAAIILSCIDSRAPAEIIMNTGIGDLFNARVAGNIENPDILGSMEFACRLAGAKLVVVMGHTKCGAVKGAIANAELGNLTSLLGKIKPVIAQTAYKGKRTAENYDFVDAVAKTNVLSTVQDIRYRSHILSSLEEAGAIKIVGAMYDVSNGRLTFL